MRNDRFPSRGFTLIELIMVMLVITIIAGAVVPLLRGFAAGQRTKDTARTIVGLVRYAHTQAISEGRTYRMNFDPANGAFWLTADSDGAFQAPGSDLGKRYQADTNVRMEVDISPAVVPLNQQESMLPGMPMTQTKSAQEPYVQFQPGGGTDPAKIVLRDNLGTTIEIACESATELFRIVPPGEMTQ